ncbi:MAG TPA: hypothetical protein VHB21_00825, partial [Minicystis sp.]|nr:hypothetical protein [Minicystis sp.]
RPWALILLGAALGAAGIVAYRQVQAMPRNGVKVDWKPSATRAPWIADGYIELVPALRLPSHVNGVDRIEVWLKVPEGAKISAKHLDAQKRWTLVYPKGTIADRLEMPDGEHIADVRGTELGDGGAEYFHVYRPDGGKMKGFIWKRDDDAQQTEATRVLLDHVQHDEHVAGREVELIKLNNACGPCHAHEREEHTKQVRNQPNRATDAAGFFVPETVLRDRGVVERHRPREMNVGDKFVQFSCVAADGTESKPKMVVHKDGMRWPICDDGTNPVGTLDVAAGLAAEDIHVVRLCKSRQHLYERMDATARDAFASAFKECKIGG